jgi:hypothetical protein
MLLNLTIFVRCKFREWLYLDVETFPRFAAMLSWLGAFSVLSSQNPPVAFLTWISPFVLTRLSSWILTFLLAWRPMPLLRPFAAFLISPAYNLIVVS